MRRALIAVLLAGGCNQVFGVQKLGQIDAYIPDVEFVPPDAPDGDRDGVPDFSDNCPTVYNPPGLDGKQSDIDGDGVGDVCDNCPIIANADQSAQGDTDLVGDACDPNPTHDGDCLLLVDAFGDPSKFASRWKVLPSGATGVTTSIHHVTITKPGSRTGIASVEVTGAQAVSVQIRGKRPNVSSVAGEVGVATTTTKYADGLQAWVAVTSTSSSELSLYAEIGTGTAMDEGVLSTAPVIGDLVLRLDVLNNGFQGESFEARADYGVAVGTARVGTPLGYATGMDHGVFANGADLEVDGIALYGTASPCPTPIIH